MEKLILISASTLFCFASINAQKVFMGLELGGNIIPVENNSLGTNFQLGPYTGVSVNYNLSDKISFSSGLYFSQRKKMYFSNDTSSVLSAFDDLLSFGGGSSIELDSLINIPGVDLNVYEDTKGIATENYLEIPLLVSYNYKNLVISAGPYFGFLLNGRKKEETRTTTPIFQVFDISSIDSTGLLSMFLPPADETEFNETSSIDNLKRFDVGAAFGVGYMIDQLKFNLSFTMGFNDYRIEQAEEAKSTHKAIRISISYYFGKNQTTAKPSL